MKGKVYNQWKRNEQGLNPMHIYGLTGGIGCGKSTVSQMFESLGAKVIDADQVARDVVKPGSDGLKALVQAFGEEILLPDGNLDRPGLGKIVFADEYRRKTLNGILHPRIGLETARRLQQERAAGTKHLIYDAALLIETGQAKFGEKLIVVRADPAVQLERLMSRDQISEDEARQKIASQMPVDQKAKMADFVVDNSGTLENTRRQVEEVWEKLTG